MAKTKLNSALAGLRGRVGDLIFKQYKYGTVVSRVPRMGQVTWSAKQLEHRKRVAAAGAYYRTVLADPELKRKYTRIAQRRGVPLSAVTFEAFMNGRTTQAAARARVKKSRTA